MDLTRFVWSLVLFALTSWCSSDASCGGNLTGYFGIIKTPNYPNTYPNFAHCVWNVKVDKGFRIRIRFTEFSVELSFKCEYDWVLLRSNKRSTRKYCGKREKHNPYNPRLLTSPSNEASLIFHSDYSNEEKYIGFVAYFAAIDTDECSKKKGQCDHHCHNYLGGHYCSCRAGYRLLKDKKSCRSICKNQQLTARRGTITTPEFPGLYPKNAKCDWTISVKNGYRITLYFKQFDIEAHPEVPCPYDYLKVSAGIGRRYGPLCGKSLPKNITTSGNYMNIQFVSDATGSYKGFEAFYETHVIGITCPMQTAPLNGIMKGKYFSLNYTLKFECLPGYLLFGSYVRECNKSGRWSGVTPSCRPRSCGHPGIPEHGFLVSKKFSYLNNVHFSCNQFFELHGNKSRSCQADGTWSGTVPKCIAICGETRFNNTRRQQCRQRIVGGQDTVKGAYPWHVLITIDGAVSCGGSLLNKLWILTAAHCFTDNKANVLNTTRFQILLGLFKMSKANETHVQKRNVSQIVTHSGFDYLTFDSDLALIKLEGEIMISDYVRPVCLPHGASQRSLVTPNRFGMAVGWGKMIGREASYQLTNSLADTLKEACLPVVSQGVCQRAFIDEGYTITNNMTCAGNASGGNDFCQGDSGDGFVFFDHQSKKWVLGGIASWGSSRGCGLPNKYGVYVKLTNYIDWIQRNMV